MKRYALVQLLGEWISKRVQLAENMAVPVREKILQSGDEQLVRILRILPEESFARLKGILQQR